MPQVSPVDIIAACRNKPVSFNRHVLGRVHESLPEGYHSKQVEILQAVQKCRKVCVPAGHGTGKGYLASGCALHFLYTNPYSKVVLLGPSYTQVTEALWPEVTSAWRNASIKLPGKLLNGTTLKIEVEDKWSLICSSADTSGEALAGKHAGKFLIICDEASWEGYDKVLEDLEGMNASNYLFLGNPLRNNRFKRLCDSADDVNIKVINMSSLESPHAEWARSPVGMADKGFIDDMRSSYGEDSPQWRARVLGQFNAEDEFQLIPGDWIDGCEFPHPGRTGTIRMGVDLSKGVGGTSDNSVILVWDDAGILDLEYANTWALETTAQLVVAYQQKWNIEPAKITFDGTGLGLGFGNQLDALGLRGCRAYIGTSTLRSIGAWEMRKRLDPIRKVIPVPDPRTPPRSSMAHLFLGTIEPTVQKPYNQAPFSIKKDWLQKLRPEFLSLRYKLSPSGGIVIEPKDELKKRLGHSPDLADAFLISCTNP